VEPSPDPWGETGLVELGLVRGDVVRFRNGPTSRWREATVERRERDGSVGLRDGRGAARAIPVGQLEVRRRGPRGGRVWEPLEAVAARTEQRRLL
jgi:hypothetical protein